MEWVIILQKGRLPHLLVHEDGNLPREVLVPVENRKDIEEISEEIKQGLVITYVKDMKEVLARALVSK